jgi:secreted trypsin-like serine protease
MAKIQVDQFNMKLNLLILLGFSLLNYCRHGYRENQGVRQREVSELSQLVLQNKSSELFERATQHTVEIFHKSKFGTCSGVIIGDQQIITAAHCVESAIDGHAIVSPKNIEIRFRKNSKANPVVVAVKEIFVSASFKGSQFEKQKGVNTNDLALLILQNQVPKAFAPVKIQAGKSMIHYGTPLIFAGFGHFSVTENTSTPSLHTGILTISEADFSETEFSVTEIYGKGPCKGDSGGPAFVVNQGKLELLGIISRGDHLCTFSVYTHSEQIQFFLNEVEKIQKQKTLSLFQKRAF